MNQDESQLNSLAIAHYVVGGFMILISCLPLIHVIMGSMFIWGWCGNLPETSDPIPPFFGWIFFIVGIVAFVLAQVTSILVILSGRCLMKRKRYIFSFIMACLACFFVPLGTLLGIFTIIVLSRDSVKQLYERGTTL